MKKLFLIAAFGMVTTGAFAQDYDRGRDWDHRDGYRHEDRDVPGRIIGHTLRAIEGRSADEGCRTIIERRERPDGDEVTTRRRVCD